METWFSILHRRTIRRGVSSSVGSLEDAVHRFLDAWNNNEHPFVRVKTPDQILAKASMHQ